MPFYLYNHHCGYEALLQRKIGDHILDCCPGCNATIILRPVINRKSCPNIMLSSVTNNMYNNGQGKYDMGLGRTIASRQEHEKVMKELGVEVADQVSAEEFIEKSNNEQDKDIKVPIEYIKDKYEYYKAEVDKGLTFENKPEPENFTPKILETE